MKIDFEFENSWKLHGDFHILPQLTLERNNSWKLHGDFHILPQLTLERNHKSYSIVFGFLCWSGFIQIL